MRSQSTEPYLALGFLISLCLCFIWANCAGQARLYGYTCSPEPPFLALAPNTLRTWVSSFKLVMLRNGRVFSEHIHIQQSSSRLPIMALTTLIMVSKHQQYQNHYIMKTAGRTATDSRHGKICMTIPVQDQDKNSKQQIK